MVYGYQRPNFEDALNPPKLVQRDCHRLGWATNAVKFLTQTYSRDRYQNRRHAQTYNYSLRGINLYRFYGDYVVEWNEKKVLEYYNKAVKIAIAVYDGEKHVSIAQIYEQLAVFWQEKENYAKAYSYERKAYNT